MVSDRIFDKLIHVSDLMAQGVVPLAATDRQRRVVLVHDIGYELTLVHELQGFFFANLIERLIDSSVIVFNLFRRYRELACQLGPIVALQIRNGEIKKFLVQPVDLIGFLLLTRIAHKFVYYIIAILPFALVFYLCRGFFSHGWPDTSTMIAYIASLIMGFLLGYFLEASIGLIGFWFLEVSSLLFIYMLFSFFLSGHMFPLDMLPHPWNTLVDLLPLKYLAYFQAAVFLGKVEGPELMKGLIVQAVWLVFFIFLARVTYWRGIKRYSGFGG